MNKRIQELAEQATSIVEMVGPQGYASSYANFDREKFAQLIVRECIGKIELEAVQYAEPVWAVELLNDIREHFGVEQ